MKTRQEILSILERLNGCQITAPQIRAQLTKPIGTSTVNWHINRLIRDGLLEPIDRTSSNQGNVIKVNLIKLKSSIDHTGR